MKAATQKALALQGSTMPQLYSPSMPAAFTGHITPGSQPVSDTARVSVGNLYISWINALVEKQNITQSEAFTLSFHYKSPDAAAQWVARVGDLLFSGLNRHVKRLPVPVVVHNEKGFFNPKDLTLCMVNHCAPIAVPRDPHPQWHPDKVKKWTSSGFTIHDLFHSLFSMTVLNDTVGQAICNVVTSADTTTVEGKQTVMPLYWLLHEANFQAIYVGSNCGYNPQYQYFTGHVLQDLCKEFAEKGQLDRAKERTGPAGSTYTLDGLATDVNNTLKKMGVIEQNVRQIEKRDLKDVMQMVVERFGKERKELNGLRAILRSKKVTQDALDTVKTKLGLSGEYNATDLRQRVAKALKTVDANKKFKVKDLKKSMEESDAKIRETLGGLARDKKQLQDLHAIVTAQNINVIKERRKTYTTNPHTYVDRLFDPLIAASKGSVLRDDAQQLDAMIGWVDKDLCRKKYAGTPRETYDNWGTFAQWAKECKAKLHAEINKIEAQKGPSAKLMVDTTMNAHDESKACADDTKSTLSKQNDQYIDITKRVGYGKGRGLHAHNV